MNHGYFDKIQPTSENAAGVPVTSRVDCVCPGNYCNNAIYIYRSRLRIVSFVLCLNLYLKQNRYFDSDVYPI